MVPANGGRAKRDVMCADPSPLLTEDQCLLPPQHRERGAVLPSGLGVSGGDVGVGRQRGQSQGIWSFTPADGVPGAAQGVSPSAFHLLLQWTEGVALWTLLLLLPHALDLPHQDIVGEVFLPSVA